MDKVVVRCRSKEVVHKKEVFAFFGNLNLEKWHKYADFGVKYIFLLCKTAIIVIFVW